MSKTKWPDEIREEMIRKSEYYDNSQIYQYGYYDGYQKGVLVSEDELEKKIVDWLTDLNLTQVSVQDIRNLINSLTNKAK